MSKSKKDANESLAAIKCAVTTSIIQQFGHFCPIVTEFEHVLNETKGAVWGENSRLTSFQGRWWPLAAATHPAATREKDLLTGRGRTRGRKWDLSLCN